MATQSDEPTFRLRLAFLGLDVLRMLRWCFALLTSDAWVLDSFDGLVDFGKPKKVIPILFKIKTVARNLINPQAKIANLGHPDITVIGFCPPEKLLPLVLKLR